MKDKKSIRPTYDQLTTNLRIHTKTFVEKRKRYNLKIALLKGFVDLCRIIKNSQSVPDNEVLTERQVRKPQYLCGFRDFPNRINLPLYTKFTPIGAKNGAETKKSHNLRNEWAVP